MKVLVTGATGFIGRHVIQRLLNDGHEVVATGISQQPIGAYQWLEHVPFIEFAFPAQAVEQDLFAFFGQPDAVIHLAWQGLPNYKASFHIDQNLFKQFLFLKNLIKHGLKNLTVTGTCFEYGMQSGCLHEAMPTLPANAYALAKDSLRLFLESLQTEYPFMLRWVRLFYLYGEGQSPNSIIPLLDQAIDREDSVFNMSGGEQLRDYLPIEKVAKYIAMIGLHSQFNGIVNCCSGTPISIRRLVEEHIQKRNATIKLNLGYYPYPDYEPMAFWGDNGRLNELLSNYA